MAWNWRKDWSVMGLLRMLVLFLLLSWCKFPFRGFISANWWSNRQQWCIKAMNRPRCFQNSCSLCLGCGRRLINFTESIFSPKWSWSVLEWRLPVPVRREMFNFSAAAQQPVGDKLYFTKSRRPRSETHLPEMRWLQILTISLCTVLYGLHSKLSRKKKKNRQKSEEFLQGAFVCFYFICAQSLTSSHRSSTFSLLQGHHPHLNKSDWNLTEGLKWCDR